jgi:murein DD-endopeptidase MepM/ murein hydrolase activator NlpD
MNIIVVGKGGRARSWHLSSGLRFLLLFCIALLPAGLGVAGYVLSVWLAGEPIVTEGLHKEWQAKLSKQKNQLETLKQSADEELLALTVRLAEMQARLTRLDAVGERLIQTSRLNKGEFDFSREPALGGPHEQLPEMGYKAPSIDEAIAELQAELENRETQLNVLSTLIKNRKLREDAFIAGRPILRGWMSSRYGRRTDPFSGRLAWHSGVDFAGKEGSPIITVASGVVTWASERFGYGLMIEINHGSGYSTRYAHCKELKVQVGDVVRKGQTIADMGSTGRSTGPHVHFEVYKNGRTVDPAAYIHRTHP